MAQTQDSSADPSTVERVLLKDYEAALAFVDKLDGQLLAIRNLAVVSASAVMAYSVSENAVWPLLANVAVLPAFMLMELVYKAFHEDGIARVWHLESHMVKAIDERAYPADYQFGIGHAIKPLTIRRMAKLALDRERWHIHLLYAVLALLTFIALFVPLFRATGDEIFLLVLPAR